jgi:hypothetical protein
MGWSIVGLTDYLPVMAEMATRKDLAQELVS